MTKTTTLDDGRTDDADGIGRTNARRQTPTTTMDDAGWTTTRSTGRQRRRRTDDDGENDEPGRRTDGRTMVADGKLYSKRAYYREILNRI